MTYKKRLLTTRNDSQTSTELCLQYQVWAEFIASLKKGAEDRGVLLQHWAARRLCHCELFSVKIWINKQKLGTSSNIRRHFSLFVGVSVVRNVSIYFESLSAFVKLLFSVLLGVNNLRGRWGPKQ